MEWVTIKEKLTFFLKKYAYVVLVLCVGLILMLIPTHEDKEIEASTEVSKLDEHSALANELSKILGHVAGAGEVRVMLSIASGQETLYQTNDNFSTGNDSGTSRLDTVTVTDAQRNEHGLVRQVNPPVYRGAIIVCKGAQSPSVRLAIMEAVADVTGLGIDKISVLLMK